MVGAIVKIVNMVGAFVKKSGIAFQLNGIYLTAESKAKRWPVIYVHILLFFDNFKENYFHFQVINQLYYFLEENMANKIT